MNPSLPGAWKLFKESFRFYLDHWKVLLGITAIPFLFALPPTFFRDTASGIRVPLEILSFVITFLSSLALLRAVTENGNPLGGVAGAFKRGLLLFFPFLWINVLIGVSTAGATLLFVIPGIVLAVYLSMSAYVLFAENRRGMSALIASWHYVYGYFGSIIWRQIFVFILVFLVTFIGGLIIVGPSAYRESFTPALSGEMHAFQTPIYAQLIYLFWVNLIVVPLGVIYAYRIYIGLKEIKTSNVLDADASCRKKWIIAYSIIGIVGAVLILFFMAAMIMKFVEQGLQFGPLPPIVS